MTTKQGRIMFFSDFIFYLYFFPSLADIISVILEHYFFYKEALSNPYTHPNPTGVLYWTNTYKGVCIIVEMSTKPAPYDKCFSTYRNMANSIICCKNLAILEFPNLAAIRNFFPWEFLIASFYCIRKFLLTYLLLGRVVKGIKIMLIFLQPTLKFKIIW